jgi:hypothetical protein
MSDQWLLDLQRYRLIDLVTYRRNGAPVATPVRYAIDNDRLVVSLQSDSGKVKRARANPAVQVAGHPGGSPREATLRFLDGDQARLADDALRRRHRLLFIQRLVFGRRPRRHTIAEIRLHR